MRQLTVLVGGNGVGKTNLYRALELMHAAATGRIAHEIAREGGLGSVFWAGGRNLGDSAGYDPAQWTFGMWKGQKSRLMLEAVLADLAGVDARYRIELGYPTPNSAAFQNEVLIKQEEVRLLGPRPATVLERKAQAVWARDRAGRRELVDETMLPSETALAAFGPSRAEVDAVRIALANWRFFHTFRTDPDSPLRRPCHAVTAPLLDSDGANLAAVFATLHHIRQDSRELDAAVESAFPGAQLVVPPPGSQASFGMIFPEMPKRVFAAHELSDGTLRFLGLLGALQSYRLPPFIALNEPETSLHPSLLPALAQSIVRAAERTQIWVVTHARDLADAIGRLGGIVPREVTRGGDGTAIRGLTPLGAFEGE